MKISLMTNVWSWNQTRHIIQRFAGKMEVSIKERSDGKIGIDLGLKKLTTIPEEICYNSDMQQCSVWFFTFIIWSRPNIHWEVWYVSGEFSSFSIDLFQHFMQTSFWLFQWIDLSRNKLDSLDNLELLIHLQEVYIGRMIDGWMF